MYASICNRKVVSPHSNDIHIIYTFRTFNQTLSIIKIVALAYQKGLNNSDLLGDKYSTPFVESLGIIEGNNRVICNVLIYVFFTSVFLYPEI